jgi:hypothetical protein
MKKFFEKLVRQTTVLILWLSWKYSPKLVVVRGEEGRQYTETVDDPARRPMHCLECGWFGQQKDTTTITISIAGEVYAQSEYCPHCSMKVAFPIDMLCESTSLNRFLKFAALEL